jgi:hypothetical protein
VAAGRDLVRCEQPILVLATVPAQHDLVALSVRLTGAGVRHRVFTEDDMGGRPTALATEAVLQGQRKHLRDLPLYKPIEALAAA